MSRALLVLLFAVVGGCSTMNPQQAAFALKSQYSVTIAAADAYGKLPFCGGTVIVCADRTVVAKIKTAKDVASPAMQAVEAAVRDPAFNQGAYSSVLVAAREALAALAKIIPQLPHPPAHPPTEGTP